MVERDMYAELMLGITELAQERERRALPYEEKLKEAKRLYVSAEAPHETHTRLLWCLEQVGHAYTNIPVECLRSAYRSLQTPMTLFGRTKDRAYWLGHLIQLFPPFVVGIWYIQRKRHERNA